jgi:hypothetical protein
MALGITFPLNITIGIPLYWSLVSWQFAGQILTSFTDAF